MIMNKIKMQISKLNSAQRAKAISQLRRVTSNTVQVSQTVPTLTTHIQDLPQIPVLPAPQIPASLTPQIPVPSVPQIPGPSVPQIPIPSVPQIPGPSVPQIPGDIPNQIPPVTIPLSSQHISTGGQ